MIDSIDSCYLIKQDYFIFTFSRVPRLDSTTDQDFFSRRRTQDTGRVGLRDVRVHGVLYGTESKRTGSRGRRVAQEKTLWRSSFPSFHFLHCLFVFLFLPSLARANACMLLFNQEVGGSTRFLHYAHEFYEKGREK